jgi:hypothetical protein
MKAGPMGKALISALKELPLISNNTKMMADLSVIGGKGMVQWLERLMPYARLVGRKPCLGKLSIFGDKEGKTRIVAIVDYWTQSALRPYHDALMGILKRLPADCTFNQDNFEHLLTLPGPYQSIDLSNATDRMPLWLQKSIMEYIFGKEISAAWASLLTEREYASPIGPLIYKAGQPMGAYSSWASMALTHHFIVQAAAFRIGHRKMFKSYALLGDDLVLADPAVAESYKELLLLLDMPYSKAKTHESVDSWEFAKRWYIQRVEVTPYSVGGLKEVKRSYPLLHNFLTNQAKHGWPLPDEDSAIAMILALPGSPTKRRKSVSRNLIAFSHLRRLLADSANPDLAYSFWKYTLSWISGPVHSSEQIISNIELVWKALEHAQNKVLKRNLTKFQEHAEEFHKNYLAACSKIIVGFGKNPALVSASPGVRSAMGVIQRGLTMLDPESPRQSTTLPAGAFIPSPDITRGEVESFVMKQIKEVFLWTRDHPGSEFPFEEKPGPGSPEAEETFFRFLQLAELFSWEESGLGGTDELPDSRAPIEQGEDPLEYI